MAISEGEDFSRRAMPAAHPQPRSERRQTDESLRVERETADDSLAETMAAIEETADAVISLARARADDVLAAARAKTDRSRTSAAASVHATEVTRRERVQEDRTVSGERADADETLRVERAEQGAQLSMERGETDKDLFNERARSDVALAARDEFLAVVSHDLRDMLDAMVRFAAVIEKEASRPDRAERVRSHAQRIRGSGARMNRLIGDLVDVASIEAGTLAVTRELADPAQVVREAVDSFHVLASASGVSLLVDVVPSSMVAAFDPARILQVLSNLLSNAIKFTSARGEVRVLLERVGDDARIAVRDTGIGIPEDKLEAVFERFLQVARNDRRGVGLGLYISRCIVHGHGGRIWAESTVGQGTTVFFTLPVRLPA